VRLEECVELVEHDARLHRHRHRIAVECDDAVERLAVVDHQRFADALPALRRAGTARQQRHVEIARHRHRSPRVVLVAGHHDADGKYLIDRCVGRVTAARAGVEQHVAAAFLAQTRRKPRGIDRAPEARRHAD